MYSQIFIVMSVLSVAIGGLLAAFSANRPSTFRVWASAYLVLVVGLVQFGLAIGWQWLGEPNPIVATLAFIVYNLGSALVVYGTARKWQKRAYKPIVNSGGGLLLASMVLLMLAVRSTAFSWTLVWFLALVLVILIFMPVGLYLSANRRKSETLKSPADVTGKSE